MTRAFRILVFLAWPALGCATNKGVTPPPTTSAAGLQELGELYQYLAHEKLPPPGNIADLEQHEAALPAAWDRLQSGEIVLFYGVGFDKNDNRTILAYEKKTPTEGGKVLLRNGSVKEMTPAEFAGAPTAGR